MYYTNSMESKPAKQPTRRSDVVKLGKSIAVSLPDIINLLTEIRNNNVVVDAMLYNDPKDLKRQKILSQLDFQVRSVVDAYNLLAKGGK